MKTNTCCQPPILLVVLVIAVSWLVSCDGDFTAGPEGPETPTIGVGLAGPEDQFDCVIDVSLSGQGTKQLTSSVEEVEFSGLTANQTYAVIMTVVSGDCIFTEESQPLEATCPTVRAEEDTKFSVVIGYDEFSDLTLSCPNQLPVN